MCGQRASQVSVEHGRRSVRRISSTAPELVFCRLRFFFFISFHFIDALGAKQLAATTVNHFCFPLFL